MAVTMDDFVRLIEHIAPPGLADEWDNSGLLLCCGETVSRVLIALDATTAVVDEAAAGGFDMVLTHHPTLFSPVRRLDYHRPPDAVVMRLISAGISLYAAHTPYDKAGGGINDMLSEKLGLSSVAVAPGPDDGLMRVGRLDGILDTGDFLTHVKRTLKTEPLRVSDVRSRPIQTVAVVGGSGGDFVAAAKAAGADALVTGEAKHHHFIDAVARDMLLVEAGHFATEQGFSGHIFMSLQSRLDNVQLHLDFQKAKCETAPYTYI